MRFAPTLTRTIVAALLALAGAALAQEPEHDHDHGQQAEDHGVEISLTPGEQREFGVMTAVAGPDTLSTVIRLPGTIHPNDDRLAHLVPRYDGIVTAVHVHVGDEVGEGQTLATIESDQSLAPYELKTMIGGTVIAKHITLGESASRDRAPFVVADLSTVWLDLFLYQRDLDQVRVGQRLLGCEPGSSGDAGRISYVSPVVDETTRTALARVVLDNRDGRWRPGMFVTAEIETDRFAAPVAVPRSAVFTLDGKTVVFTADEHGFAAREIQTGRGDRNRVEILAGLHAGETYVAAGGFTLKSELEKHGFDDGHNH